MLTAYVDESGQEQKDWMFVAGFFGNDDQWRATADAWKEAIAPRPKLHMVNLRFKKDRERRMLERAGAVTKNCGLTPIVGGVRQGDYEDLIAGTPEEKALTGYFFCSFGMIVNTLRGIPANEKLEVVFEHTERHWWMTEIAMRVISDLSTELQDMLLPDGTPKLANWRSVPKGATPLTEPADCFAYALLQKYRDKASLKARWTNPILEAHNQEGLGAILNRSEIRQIVQGGRIQYMLDEARRMLKK